MGRSGNKGDRFALINFATTVNRYKDGLLDASSDQVAQAKKWVDNRDATGGTAIYDALESAQALLAINQSFSFSGQSNCEAITAGSSASDTTETINNFGVGASTAFIAQTPCD